MSALPIVISAAALTVSLGQWFSSGGVSGSGCCS